MRERRYSTEKEKLETLTFSFLKRVQMLPSSLSTPRPLLLFVPTILNVADEDVEASHVG